MDCVASLESGKSVSGISEEGENTRERDIFIYRVWENHKTRNFILWLSRTCMALSSTRNWCFSLNIYSVIVVVVGSHTWIFTTGPSERTSKLRVSSSLIFSYLHSSLNINISIEANNDEIGKKCWIKLLFYFFFIKILCPKNKREIT